MSKTNIGDKYGKLTVLAESPQRIRNRICWECECECGEKIIAIGTDLRTNKKRDCGNHGHANTIDEIGNRYGRLLVLKRSEKRASSRKVYWICKCDCGNQVEVCGSDLRQGKTQSCGCYNQESKGQSVLKNEIGNKYGKLTVIDKIKQNNKETLWVCKCDCGNITYSKGPDLRNGHKKSCGCIHSFAEADIENFLQVNNIFYQKQIAFKDLISEKGGHPRFDFGFLKEENNFQFLIEYQGEQHYIDKGEFGKTQREITDKLKRDYCEKNNIELYEIKYNEDTIEKLKEILQKEGLLSNED